MWCKNVRIESKFMSSFLCNYFLSKNGFSVWQQYLQLKMMKTKVKYGTDTGKLYVYDTRTLKWRHRNTACFTKSTCTCKSFKFFFIIYQMLHILKLGITLSPPSLSAWKEYPKLSFILNCKTLFQFHTLFKNKSYAFKFC